MIERAPFPVDATPITSRVKYKATIQIQPINEMLRRIGATDPDLTVMRKYIDQARAAGHNKLAKTLHLTRMYYITAGRFDRFAYIDAEVEIEHFHSQTTYNISHMGLRNLAKSMILPSAPAEHRDDLLAIFDAFDLNLA